RQNQPLTAAAFLFEADAPGLIELAPPFFPRILGVEQQLDLAPARRDFDLLGAEDEVPGARFEAEPVERGLAQRRLGPFAEILRNGERARLERPRQGAAQLALGLSRIERRTVDPDPRAPARRTGAHVGRDLAVRAEREAHQFVPRSLAAAQDAGALGAVGFSLIQGHLPPFVSSEVETSCRAKRDEEPRLRSAGSLDLARDERN